ncbi:unnamed protein product [Rotaria sordida]|uniref:VWFA domain-containing protein n=1 Tax=Rotaria sordida TaxID=392033 RepID=A0A815C958_9BILA|nr:unnamed protein product [Rotaria sordida]CAF1078227.1 unnamed protein product [Rotaria sordida]CAF1279776.1 unnamed protein product [Rotaria sordida]CAF3815393.1 unnamed protein product [Rotaria sordida]
MTANSTDSTMMPLNAPVLIRSRSCTISTEPGREATDDSVSSFDGEVHIARDGLQENSSYFNAELNEIEEERLMTLVLTYEIRKNDVQRLRKLKNFEIVILCDDSGTMTNFVDGTTRTRWDELRMFVRLVVEIGTIFDSNGINIHFLNRQNSYRITNPKDVERLFKIPPRGYTPLARVLRNILQSHVQHQQNKKLLIFIATDGIPTDDDGNPNLPEFKHVMEHERQVDNTHVMFLICTDDSETVSYLRQWDAEMVNVDVTDDYQTQKKMIREIHGANYPFSYADYVVKVLVGAIDPDIDRSDDLPDEDDILS